jgi:hypothetical protein
MAPPPVFTAGPFSSDDRPNWAVVTPNSPLATDRGSTDGFWERERSAHTAIGTQDPSHAQCLCSQVSSKQASTNSWNQELAAHGFKNLWTLVPEDLKKSSNEEQCVSLQMPIANLLTSDVQQKNRNPFRKQTNKQTNKPPFQTSSCKRQNLGQDLGQKNKMPGKPHQVLGKLHQVLSKS